MAKIIPGLTQADGLQKRLRPVFPSALPRAGMKDALGVRASSFYLHLKLLGCVLLRLGFYNPRSTLKMVQDVDRT